MSTVAGPARVRTALETTSPAGRLRGWWQRGRLDAQLADGVDPSSTALLERRAAQLTSTACRRTVAVGIERVVEAAEEPPFTLSARAPLRRAQVLGARRALANLAEELTDGTPVRAQGVALAERLLTDVRGPFYTATTPEDIERAVRAARAAL